MTTLAGIDVRASVWDALKDVLQPAMAWTEGNALMGAASVTKDAVNDIDVLFVSPDGDVKTGSLIEQAGKTYKVNDVTGTDDAFACLCEVVPSLNPRGDLVVSVSVSRPYVTVTRTEPGTAQIAGRFSFNGEPWVTMHGGTSRTLRARYSGAGVMQGEVWRELADGSRSESQAIAASVT